MLAQLAQHLERRAANRIPAGSTWVISINDIDMAGGFERWHRAGVNRVRVMRDVYPPRIDLAFRLTGAAGKVFAGGQRGLTNLSFMTNVDYCADLLRHEKRLLDDWLAREFPDAAAY